MKPYIFLTILTIPFGLGGCFLTPNANIDFRSLKSAALTSHVEDSGTPAAPLPPIPQGNPKIPIGLGGGAVSGGGIHGKISIGPVSSKAASGSGIYLRSLVVGGVQ
ncbi:MAG: hypothetical protein A2428_13040 [Bdellovibrionales bacterium RIFOXYC1_FULL_54_43]|nr:MAG: hypothetical protein A2428_13040 [Bdellovibrionales bacterium RIFOXYC1_FULL_54_43]OFZ79628.1 MAG: hypothetical protein A2603_03955 [Bdellovibrionales bacterium RIFOXYD1_FULL_55_31]